MPSAPPPRPRTDPRPARSGSQPGDRDTTGLLGIDVGTTSIKAVVVDLRGRPRSSGAVATPWERVGTGAEASPAGLLDAVHNAVRRALAGAAGPILAVGVTSMAETGVLLDEGGRSLTPAVSWNDRRAHADGVAMGQALDARQVAARTGLKVGGKLTAAMYRSLVRAGVDVARGRRWLSVAEWVVHALGGDAAAELSLASRTGWLDLDRRDWWPEALGFSGIDPRSLPELRQAGSSWGRVTDERAGLEGAVLTVAGHDHQAAAVGAGATRPGDVLDSCGTAEALVRSIAPVAAGVRERVVAEGLSVGWGVLGGRMVIVGGFPSGDRLRRVLDLVGEDQPALDERADAVDVVPAIDLDGLDALLAEDPAVAWASWRQRVAGTDPAAALWRAATDAIARRGARLLRQLDDAVGPHERVVVVGGWARGGALLRAKQQLLGAVHVPDVAEAGAHGAALLAGVAAGVRADATAVPAPGPAAPRSALAGGHPAEGAPT